jgi:hypothetical protein
MPDESCCSPRVGTTAHSVWLQGRVLPGPPIRAPSVTGPRVGGSEERHGSEDRPQEGRGCFSRAGFQPNSLLVLPIPGLKEFVGSSER